MAIEKNVTEFLNIASNLVGKWQADIFSQDIFQECRDNEIGSPIERILYIALKALAHISYIQEADDPVQENGEWHVAGLCIQPQKKIGNYRVDFAVFHERKLKNIWEFQEVLVECDSQQFHERTEQERRYEKQRDRFLIAHGHKVLHFTGSEIIQNPWKVAAEILEAVCTDRPSSEDLLDGIENYL